MCDVGNDVNYYILDTPVKHTLEKPENQLDSFGIHSEPRRDTHRARRAHHTNTYNYRGHSKQICKN